MAEGEVNRLVDSDAAVNACEPEVRAAATAADEGDVEVADRLSETFELADAEEANPSGDVQFGFFQSPDPLLLPDFGGLDADAQERLQAVLQAAGIAKMSKDGKSVAMFADPDVLRHLSTSVSSALGEAADTLSRMKDRSSDGDALVPPSCDRLLADENAGVAFGFAQPGSSVAVEEGESLLSLACSAGYYELAQVLLAMRTNIEDRGSKGDCTPLMEAASAGHLDIVRLLLSHGADANAQSSTGNTPLMYACAGGHEAVVNALLESDADVDLRNENGHCPLMESASAGHVSIARALVNGGAAVNVANNGEFKESPLTLASYKGHSEMVRFLLKAGSKANNRSEELHTALMEASMDGHLEVAQLLLDFGAPVNLNSDSFESPLTLAACGGHVDLVRLLVERGSQIEEANDEGYTPLMEAAREGHADVVDALLDHGADINAQTDETGETALTLAACGGFSHVAELLLERGADLALGANTALMEAAQEGHLETAQLLVAATLKDGSQSIDVATATGDTALTYAAENGHTEVCAALVASGAYIDHEAEGGRTALMKAAKAGHLCVTQLLLSKGAQVDKTSAANEHTALSLACSHGHRDVAQLLLQHGANPNHRLKDNATCFIEAAKGGHTQVVELLLDWPGIELPQFTAAPPSLQQLAGSASVGVDMAAKATAKRGVAQSSPLVTPVPNQATDETAAQPQAFNFTLDPQFLASVQRHQQQPFDAAGALVKADDSCESDNAQPILNSDWLLMQAQRALIKQAGEKLSEEEVRQLSELLKTQFRNMFPNFSASGSSAVGTGLSSFVDFPQPAAPPPPPPPPPPPSDDSSGASAAKRKAPSNTTLVSAMKDLKLLQNSGAKGGGSAIADSIAKNDASLQAGPPPGVLSKTSTMAMADGSIYRGDGTVLKPDGSIVRVAGAHGFNFQPPPPPPPTAAAIKPVAAKQIGGAGRGGAPQKVNAATQASLVAGADAASVADVPSVAVDLNTATESNNDTALTLACAGGHEELVALLLERGADIEHRDRKGFTPLILAATAGHTAVVETLLNHGACIEAQSEKTKDTALSLACSGGRKEVVEVLLKRNANKEHRNLSDYTPLSLAASGGYVDIVQLLLNGGAEINSRTGSKLGISPLMLAAMNGHAAAVKLLLERGSDINAQIETNRNTALTLACFQGRHDVVRQLLTYRANVEHRAKTGLTPLMEAASGGYVDVGRVLLQAAADPNTAPVPSSRDTALTIAADKGHHKFVELLLNHGAQLDARNKKGCTPLWLAAHGGHLETVQWLVKHRADADAADNRRVSPLVAAFRKGHVKVVKWMVRHVQQFPSDQECSRFLATITDKDQLVKCRQCMEVIIAAKDRQAQEANKAAETLLEQLAKEEEQAATRKLAKQRQKEKKKAKKHAKKVTTQKTADDEADDAADADAELAAIDGGRVDRSLTPDASRESSVSTPSPPPPQPSRPPTCAQPPTDSHSSSDATAKDADVRNDHDDCAAEALRTERRVPPPPDDPPPAAASRRPAEESGAERRASNRRDRFNNRRSRVFASSTHQQAGEKPVGATASASLREERLREAEWRSAGATRRRQQRQREPTKAVAQMNGVHTEEVHASNWREVRRRANKLTVSSQAIARVIGRGGQNINAIREATGAHIEVEKQQPKREQQERQITIRGSADAIRQAVLMINGLIEDNEAPVSDIVERVRAKDAARPASATPVDGSAAPQPSARQAKTTYPDVTSWPGGGQSGRPASADQASAPSSEYSPFATPNVWAQRAALRQMQQQQQVCAGGRRMDFAAVAASGVSSVQSSSPPMGGLMTTAPSFGSPDQNKAPGFRRPSAQAHSPTGATTSCSQSLAAHMSVQSKSAINSPIAPSLPLSAAVDMGDLGFAPIGLPPANHRPASATPVLGPRIDSVISASSYTSGMDGGVPANAHPNNASQPYLLATSSSSEHAHLASNVSHALADYQPASGWPSATHIQQQLRSAAEDRLFDAVDWSTGGASGDGIGSLSTHLAHLQLARDVDEVRAQPPPPQSLPQNDWDASVAPPSQPFSARADFAANHLLNSDFFKNIAQLLAQQPPGGGVDATQQRAGLGGAQFDVTAALLGHTAAQPMPNAPMVNEQPRFGQDAHLQAFGGPFQRGPPSFDYFNAPPPLPHPSASGAPPPAPWLGDLPMGKPRYGMPPPQASGAPPPPPPPAQPQWSASWM